MGLFAIIILFDVEFVEQFSFHAFASELMTQKRKLKIVLNFYENVNFSVGSIFTQFQITPRV